MSTPRPVVVSGPSGAGKSTLLKKLFDEFPTAFGFSVSHTTRGPRDGEVDGVAYHFTTREAMQAAIDKGDFLESAQFGKNLYGTSKQAVRDVLAAKKICILDIEKQGCELVRATNLNAKFVSIQPPSLEVLEKRLRSRGTETEEDLQLRLAEAKEALEYAKLPGKFEAAVVNDDVEEAYGQLKAILNFDIAAVQALQAGS